MDVTTNTVSIESAISSIDPTGFDKVPARSSAVTLWTDGVRAKYNKAAELLSEMQAKAPNNEMGYPRFIYDPTTFVQAAMFADVTDDIDDKIIKESQNTVYFFDGIPCIEGIPVWERLDGERMDHYQLFKQYREMRYVPQQKVSNQQQFQQHQNQNQQQSSQQNAQFSLHPHNPEDVSQRAGSYGSVSSSEATETKRTSTSNSSESEEAMAYQPATLLSSPENKNVTLYGSRSVGRLSLESGYSGRELTTLSRLYHWMFRVKAYDAYKEQMRILERRKAAEELEDRHASLSKSLVEDAVKYLRENPKQLNGKLAVELLELGMRYERISTGLMADKPGASQGNGNGNSPGAASGPMGNAFNPSITINTANVANSNGDASQSSQGALSAVEMQLQENMKDQGHLISVLHVLKQSGAMKTAIADLSAKDRIDQQERVEALEATLHPNINNPNPASNATPTPEYVIIDNSGKVDQSRLDIKQFDSANNEIGSE